MELICNEKSDKMSWGHSGRMLHVSFAGLSQDPEQQDKTLSQYLGGTSGISSYS